MLGAISPSVPPLGAKRTTGAQRQVIGTQMKDKAPYPDPPWADSGDPKSQGPKVNFFFFFYKDNCTPPPFKMQIFIVIIIVICNLDMFSPNRPWKGRSKANPKWQVWNSSVLTKKSIFLHWEICCFVTNLLKNKIWCYSIWIKYEK